MRKIVLIVVVLVLAIFSLLLASKFLPGFDNLVNSSILAPFAAFFGGIVVWATSSPIWVSYGYYISFAVGFITLALLAYVVWPRARKIKPQLQQDITLQRDVPPAPPRQVSTVAPTTDKPPPATEAEVEAQ